MQKWRMIYYVLSPPGDINYYVRERIGLYATCMIGRMTATQNEFSYIPFWKFLGRINCWDPKQNPFWLNNSNIFVRKQKFGEPSLKECYNEQSVKSEQRFGYTFQFENF